MFDPRVACRSLDRYRRKGLGRLERSMVGSALRQRLDDVRVLDLGGGIGALHAELLEAGAAAGEIVELVGSYQPYALELARERGLESRTAFRVADVLEHPEDVDAADVVLLNRVVCCSPEGVRLARVAAGLARKTLVLSFPRNRLLVRVGVAMANAWLRLRRRSFRVFLHSRAALVGAVEAEGLRLAEAGRLTLWEYVSFERP